MHFQLWIMCYGRRAYRKCRPALASYCYEDDGVPSSVHLYIAFDVTRIITISSSIAMAVEDLQCGVLDNSYRACSLRSAGFTEIAREVLLLREPGLETHEFHSSFGSGLGLLIALGAHGPSSQLNRLC